MTYQGTMRAGKLELKPPLDLPEGAHVQVEIALPETQGQPAAESQAQTHEQWLAEWRKLAEEISAHWESPKSAVEILSEMRR